MMADFTIPLRDLVEFHGWRMPSYPIFDEDYREHLDAKIIDHFWYDEIGTETIEQFDRVIRTKMNEIMPYYNALYMTERVKFDPLNNMDITTVTHGSHAVDTKGTSKGQGASSQDQTQTSDTVSHSDGSTTAKGRSVNSEYPSVRLAGNENYATNGSDSSSQSDEASNATTGVKGASTSKGSTSDSRDTTGRESGVQDGTTHASGRQGAAVDLIQKWRDSLLNIDMMVISELETCFMMVWNSNDEYTRTMRGDWYGYYF